jgi:hypothetical protein
MDAARRLLRARELKRNGGFGGRLSYRELGIV